LRGTRRPLSAAQAPRRIPQPATLRSRYAGPRDHRKGTGPLRCPEPAGLIASGPGTQGPAALLSIAVRSEPGAMPKARTNPGKRAVRPAPPRGSHEPVTPAAGRMRPDYPDGGTAPGARRCRRSAVTKTPWPAYDTAIRLDPRTRNRTSTGRPCSISCGPPSRGGGELHARRSRSGPTMPRHTTIWDLQAAAGDLATRLAGVRVACGLPR